MRRAVSIAALIAIDVTGLTIGLYIALALRSVVRDPKPILWNLLWKAETDWLPFLVLLMLLVFWRNRLYGPRELREGAGRIVPSVLLVTALDSRVRDRHRPALHDVRPLRRGGDRDRDDDQPAPLELRDAHRVADALVRRPPARAARRRRRTRSSTCATTLGASRSGIDYEFAGHVPLGPERALGARRPRTSTS